MNPSFIHRKRLTLCVLAATLLPLTLSAQGSGTIRGKVTDRATKDRLPSAVIVVKGTSLGAAADLDGVYVIRNVPGGEQIIVASYLGYESVDASVSVSDGETLERDFALTATALEGEEVIVTAQAKGQMHAIQQQLASDKIASIVSEARIQELPDFNAAQALARLPGVSTLQSSGEASKVVIRGLAPQFNQVTVGGVNLASTGSAQIGFSSQGGTAGVINNDRSSDLSMLSPYMIKNIAVYKALTPDMNANSLGGTVNMELREAPSEPKADFLWQSGYTQKSNRYGNYRGVVSGSARFLDDQLGLYVLGNIESYDRDSDNMNAGYRITNSANIGANGYLPVRVQNVTLRRHVETRERYGVNLVADYQLPAGSIKLINMFSRLHSDFQDYQTNYNYAVNDLQFNFRGGTNNVDVMINSLNFAYDFDVMSLELRAANNYSRNHLPAAPDFSFTKTRGVNSAPENAIPESLTTLVTYGGPGEAYINNLGLYSSDYKENGQVYKLDLKVPFNLASSVTGYLKLGGDYQYKTHKNGQTTPYASLGGTNTIQSRMTDAIRQRYPDLEYDSGLNRFPATSFGFNTGDLLSPFLDSRFGDMLWVPNVGLLTDITNMLATNPNFSADSSTAIEPGGWFNGYFQKLPNTYKYIERFYSGYLMAEVNVGDFMVVGGIRYEKESSLYDAFNLKDGRDTKSQTFVPVYTYPQNEFWLPMVQSRLRLTDWLDFRYAYTQTLARPDYHQFSPHFTISYTRTNVRAGNPNLKPAQGYNHDVTITVHGNEIGLLSIGGFYKEIKNFTYATTYKLYNNGGPGIDSIASFNIQGQIPTVGADLNTYINTPYLAYVRGVEVDFQTRLWYLPFPLDGTILGVNYTRISSRATYPWRDSRTDYSTRPPVTSVFDSTRTGRLINQPNDIVNAFIGYDYGSFSARLSFLFQGNSVSGVGNFTETDGFTRDYFRMDGSVRYLFPWFGVELYMDLFNINSQTNKSAQLSISGFTNEQNYGFTGNLGVRYRI